MLSAPWTEVGRLQQEVRDIESKLHRKAESYEIHAINSRLDSLEHSLREISSTLNGIQSWMQIQEDKITQLSED